MMKKMIFLFTLLIAIFLPMKVSAEQPYIYDEYGLLTPEEQTILEEKAKRISLENECGIYIYILDKNDFGDGATLAEKTYMRYGLGYGDGLAGALLVLGMEDRSYGFTSYGAAGDVFTDTEIDNFLQYDVLPNLRNNNYYAAFDAYLDASEALLKNGYHYYEPIYTDDPIDPSTYLEKEEADPGTIALISLSISAILTAIISFILKSQLKNIAIQTRAFDYIPQNGTHFNRYFDHFLRRSVDRTYSPVSKNNNSSGGSYHSSGFHGSTGGHF